MILDFLVVLEFLGRKKALGKGGHHLGLFRPITLLLGYRGSPGSATHLTQIGARRL